MADITMCKGYDCERKQYCYRYTAQANPHRQSYFVTQPCVWIDDKTFDDWFIPDLSLEIYQHGIQTVINALTAASKTGLEDTQTRALHSIGANARVTGAEPQEERPR